MGNLEAILYQLAIPGVNNLAEAKKESACACHAGTGGKEET